MSEVVRIVRFVLDVLLPTACPACGRPGPSPCGACWRLLKPAPPVPPPAGLEVCRSLLLYEGTGRELIARLKYRNTRSIVAWLAAGMAGLVATYSGPGTIVTWAPTSPDRRRDRGFDQAELLARRLARALQLPALVLLERRRGPPQTGRPAAERSQGVTFAVPRNVTRRRVGTVILVDDVVTTGATMAAAARALRDAGASTVIGVTAGRTPLKRAKGSADA